MKHQLIISSALLASLFATSTFAKTYTIQSPDESLQVSVETENGVSWSVAYKDKPVITQSPIDIVLHGSEATITSAPVSAATRESVDRRVTPVVAQKSSHIAERYEQLSLRLNNGWGIQFRAFDNGAAYRFITDVEQEVVIEEELLSLNFPANAVALYPEEESLISHFEREYKREAVADIDAKRFASLPLYVEANGVHTVFTEADLFDYPGMFMYGTGGNGFEAGFSGFVTKATPKKGSEDRDQDIEFADHIAKTAGKRTFPWRVAVISDRAGDLVESELVYLLSRENQIGNTDWIKPGKVAWDWYNANNLHGVDFKSGINNQTYKYYIDFAEKYGLDYVILDEGWSKSTVNVSESNPDIDVKELVQYGKKKGVRIILWTLWKPLDNDLENLLATWASWGVAGIKVDFMQRADQAMVNYYEEVAKEAAKHKLLVDFHGGFKPTGLRRAYPNVLTHEGVKGNENNKWSTDVTPEHNVTLPFIRMVAGPMDFTPGAMSNAYPQNHKISHFRPMSLGTRVHQVAMYAVFESPLQMLCESPSTYYREAETTDFIARFPTVWDETRVLDAEVGNYILVARRSGDNWYIGAMTDWDERELTVDFGFLPDGKYDIDYMADGINTAQFAQDYVRQQGQLTAGDQMKIKLSSGGGWAAIVTPAVQESRP